MRKFHIKHVYWVKDLMITSIKVYRILDWTRFYPNQDFLYYIEFYEIP